MPGAATLELTNRNNDIDCVSLWLVRCRVVRFCGDDIKDLQSCGGEAGEAWEGLAQKMKDDGIFLADVNVFEQPKLLKRFGKLILSSEGIFMLRNKKLYVAPNGDPEEMEKWMLGGWEEQEGLQVPGERTVVQDMLSRWNAVPEPFRTILPPAVIIIVFVVFIILTNLDMFTGGGKKRGKGRARKPKTPKKNKST